MQLNLEVRGTLLKTSIPYTTTKSMVGYDSCKFGFDSSWKDYSKVAIFGSDTTNRIEVMLDNDTCLIPWENLVNEGYLYIGVYGVSGETLIPTNFVNIKINKGAYAGNSIPSEPTLGVQAQMVEKIGVFSQAEEIRQQQEIGRVQQANTFNTNETARKQAELQRKVVFDTHVNNIDTDYHSLKTIMLDENNAANLQNQVNGVNTQLQQTATKVEVQTEVNSLTSHLQQIDTKKLNKDEVTNVMTPKGNSLYASLPTTNNSIGDYYYVTDGDGINPSGNYAWNGAMWYFGGTGDEGYNNTKNGLNELEAFVKKEIKTTYSNSFNVINNKAFSENLMNTDIANGKSYTLIIKDVNSVGSVSSFSVRERYSDGTSSPLGAISVETTITVTAKGDVIGYYLYAASPTADAVYSIVVTAYVYRDDSIEGKLDDAINNIGTLSSDLTGFREDILDETTFNIVNPIVKSLTKSGVSLISNGDGTYTINGTATARVNFYLFDVNYYQKDISVGDYKLVGCPANGSLETYFMEIAFKDSIGNTFANRHDVGNGYVLNLAKDAVSIYLAITVMAGQTVNNLVFKPMLTMNLDATYNSYVGYTGEYNKTNENLADLNKRIDNYSKNGTVNTIYWENIVKPPYWILHIDCGRKYFTVANIKAILAKMKEAGFNQIQLHFSEDVGFRFALDDMNFKDEDGNTYDLSPCLGGNENPTKWYTQTDMDSIISYAQSLDVDVVPSFDMPGHMGRILDIFTQFKYQSSGTLDITNPLAIKFANAIVDKYSKYFVSRGCHYWNIGFDEIVSSNGFKTFYDNGEYQKVVDFANGISTLLKSNGLIPRIYNEVVYYATDYNYIIDKDIEVMNWYNSIEKGFATPNQLQRFGYKVINSSYQYYWILSQPDAHVTTEKLNNTDLLKNYYNMNSTHNGYGAILSVWCDSAGNQPSSGDGGNYVVTKIEPLIVAFGNAIKRVIN